MSFADIGFDPSLPERSLLIRDTRNGYRVKPNAHTRTATGQLVSRAVVPAAVIFAASMTWSGAALSILAQAVVLTGALMVLFFVTQRLISRGRVTDFVVDRQARILRLKHGRRHTQVLRKEEISRIDLNEGAPLLDQVRAGHPADAGQVVVTLEGGRKLTVLTGELFELEPLVRRIKNDLSVV